MVQKIERAGFLCFRREEVSGEAQKVLRAFPTKSSEKEGPKPMPSFPDMVAYVQEKVRLCACFSFSWEAIHPGYKVAIVAKRNDESHIFLILSLSGSSEDQDSS